MEVKKPRYADLNIYPGQLIEDEDGAPLPEGRYIYLADVVKIIHDYHDRLRTRAIPGTPEQELAMRQRLADEFGELAAFFRIFER